MKFSLKEDKDKKIKKFLFKFKEKNYVIELKGNNRRVQCFEFLLKIYPNFLSVHDEILIKKYDDPNKAMNEFIHDEGFNGFVLEKKINSQKGKKINAYKLDLDKITKHLNEGGDFGKTTRKQPNKNVRDQLIKRSNLCCEITGYKLFENKQKLKETNTSFLSKMLVCVYDHKVPLFKKGDDDPNKIDNWQIISEYANNEKNKVCKSCTESDCSNCALAYPEKNSIIKPTNQNLKNLNILKLVKNN